MTTIEVKLNKAPIELFKVLKFEGIAASGAEAKLFIDDGIVSVNDEVETRRRRKLYPGDKITVMDTMLVLTD